MALACAATKAAAGPLCTDRWCSLHVQVCAPYILVNGARCRRLSRRRRRRRPTAGERGMRTRCAGGRRAGGRRRRRRRPRAPRGGAPPRRRLRARVGVVARKEHRSPHRHVRDRLGDPCRHRLHHPSRRAPLAVVAGGNVAACDARRHRLHRPSRSARLALDNDELHWWPEAAASCAPRRRPPARNAAGGYGGCTGARVMRVPHRTRRRRRRLPYRLCRGKSWQEGCGGAVGACGVEEGAGTVAAGAKGAAARACAVADVGGASPAARMGAKANGRAAARRLPQCTQLALQRAQTRWRLQQARCRRPASRRWGLRQALLLFVRQHHRAGKLSSLSS